MRVIDAREPKGFFTDLGATTSMARSSGSGATCADLRASAQRGARAGRQPSTICRRLVTDEVLSLNDGRRERRLPLPGGQCRSEPEARGHSTSIRSPSTRRVLPRHGPTGDYPQSGAAGPRRVTDILLVDVTSWPEGVFADPLTVGGQGGLVFLRLLAAAGRRPPALMSTRTEFGRVPGVARGEQVIGQAFLCDQLENGAGYCRWIAAPQENFGACSSRRPWQSTARSANRAPSWSRRRRYRRARRGVRHVLQPVPARLPQPRLPRPPRLAARALDLRARRHDGVHRSWI